MLEIHKNIVLDENQQPIAVQIPIAEFEKIEEILEDYGLAKLIEESENEERLSKEEALNYYTSPPPPPPQTRRNFLQFAGFASLGLIAATLYQFVFADKSSESEKSPSLGELPKSEIPTPTRNSPAPTKPATPVNNLSKFSFEVVTVNAKGEIVNRRYREAEFFREDINGVTLEMVSIPGGTFIMGSPDTEEKRDSDEGPQHEVTVAPFFMGKYEVTQAQWQAVASLPQIKIPLGTNPSNFKGANRPVEQVNWIEAREFCERLSQKTGKTYRLPSEAEWEYACRAGTTTPFYFGETITTDLVNYNGITTYASAPKGINRQQTTDVGIFPPNAFGLYDMHGNVWEWCADSSHYYQGAPNDGSAWVEQNEIMSEPGIPRVLRGGSWFLNPELCRSAGRFVSLAADEYYFIGFRIVCSAGWTS